MRIVIHLHYEPQEAADARELGMAIDKYFKEDEELAVLSPEVYIIEDRQNGVSSQIAAPA